MLKNSFDTFDRFSDVILIKNGYDSFTVSYDPNSSKKLLYRKIKNNIGHGKLLYFCYPNEGLEIDKIRALEILDFRSYIVKDYFCDDDSQTIYVWFYDTLSPHHFNAFQFSFEKQNIPSRFSYRRMMFKIKKWIRKKICCWRFC